MTQSEIPDADNIDNRYSVVKWGSRWRVQDVLNHNAKDAPLYDTRETAQKWVDRRNTQNRKATRRE